ncbi:MAG TPA: hypothetical protein VKY65_11285 [Alphaproteobacteria bacterium]|nr:hypothetical protein [Alphaproteobacteria bacterium]
MSWLATISRELFGLFVDEPGFSAAILGWIIVATLLLPALGGNAWAGPLLFAGCAAILVENVHRAARRARRNAGAQRRPD